MLGTHHFDNPGLDVVNMDADDVLATTRQAELEDLAKRFLEFHPTAIAIEKSRHTESARDYTFGEFTPADSSKDRNEIVQIGCRLALRTTMRTQRSIMAGSRAMLKSSPTSLSSRSPAAGSSLFLDQAQLLATPLCVGDAQPPTFEPVPYLTD